MHTMKTFSIKWTLPNDAMVLNGFEATRLLRGKAAAIVIIFFCFF